MLTGVVKPLSSTRLFLGLFVGSIMANAVLGIWALLSGDFGDTQGKVLGTSFLVSAAMLSVLINIPGIRRRALWPAPLVGGIAGAFGFALFIVMVWTEPGNDNWFKLAGSCLVVAAGATLASSLALIAPPARLGWMMQTVGITLIAVLCMTVLGGLWFEPDADWYARLVGVEGVLVAAVTLLIPVISRFAPRHKDGGETIAPAGPAAVRFCPSCGSPVELHPLGAETATVCDNCGLTFTVTLSAEVEPGSGLSVDSRADQVAVS